jgi:uncharacterized membrane protein
MQFTVGSAIGFGWETFKTRPWFFVGATVVILLLYGAISAITSGIDAAIGGSADEPSLVGSLVSFVLSTFVSMGVTAFYLAAHDNPETVDLTTLWHPEPFWKFLIASLLVGLAIGIGFVLLIVPGIIAAIFFMFTHFAVIDKGLGPIEAMKESMRIGRGYRWPLLGFIVLIALIIMAGFLALVVGILVAMPVAALAATHAYRVLSGQAGPAAARVDARLAS